MQSEKRYERAGASAKTYDNKAGTALPIRNSAEQSFNVSKRNSLGVLVSGFSKCCGARLTAANSQKNNVLQLRSE
jgi:hypothetical protein